MVGMHVRVDQEPNRRIGDIPDSVNDAPCQWRILIVYQEDPVFTPPGRDAMASSSSGRGSNPFGTIVAPIGTPATTIQPPPPPPVQQTNNAAECPCCLQPGRDTALVPCGHVLCGRCVATYLKRDDADACPVCRAPVLHAMRIFL